MDKLTLEVSQQKMQKYNVNISNLKKYFLVDNLT